MCVGSEKGGFAPSTATILLISIPKKGVQTTLNRFCKAKEKGRESYIVVFEG